MLAGIDKIDNAALEMGQSSDRLHLNGVHFLKLMIQNTRRIDYLISEVVMFSVSDVKSFGGEGVRLNLDVGTTDAVDETGFTNIRISTQQDGPFVGVDGRQSAHMLSDFFKVSK